MDGLENKGETELGLPWVEQEGSDETRVPEFNTDGLTASQVGEMADLGIGPRGFNNPDVRKRAQEEAAKTRLKRGSRLLVSQDPETDGIAKAEEFFPTKNMRLVMATALSLESNKIKDWMESAGLTRTVWYSWCRVPGFREWWNKEFSNALQGYHNEWLVIGLKKMRVDFRYWESMGEKIFGYIKQMKIEKGTTEEEKALTSELLKLFTHVNSSRDARTVNATVTDVTPQLTEEEVKKLNESGEGVK